MQAGLACGSVILLFMQNLTTRYTSSVACYGYIHIGTRTEWQLGL